MHKQAKSAAAVYQVTASATSGDGEAYASPPVWIDGAFTLISAIDDSGPGKLKIIVSPEGKPNQIAFASRCPWPVTFQVASAGQLGSHGGIEVGPGATHHASLG